MSKKSNAQAPSDFQHHNAVYRRRRRLSRMMMLLSVLAFLSAIVWLLWILGMLAWRGGAALLEWQFFTHITPPPGETGGLANAIVGSLIIVSCGTLLGTPFGIMAGIYLAEIGDRERWLSSPVRFLNDMLLSAPSIIIGLFAYALIVAPMKGFSGMAGAFALSLIVIPVVLRTTDDMLRLVPVSLREAAFALGCPMWRMVLRITLRAARTGVITAILLAIARISGETAPLLFTALSNQFWALNLTEPMANLPVVIFQYAMSPFESWQHLAWGGSLLITLAVLGLNVLARVLTREKRSA